MSHTANVDPAELQRFSDIAHRWWDPQGAMRPLHELNPLRLKWIDDKVGRAGKRVLDIGCGGGILTEAMAARGAEVTGIDMTAKLLKVAELHALESGAQVDYRLTSAEALATQEPGRYDVVTCLEMLEHVPDPRAVVRACADLARPGGWIFFSTINRNPKSFLFAIVGAEYVLRLLPRGTHEYAKFIRPSELAGFCREAGLQAQASRGLQYNPITRRYWLDGNTSVNYMIATQREA
jgi:2-polyprenyl-6-hydroxyphenyl methylase/3-demethylubiquinone-9 3-methyltransferase